MCNNLLVTLYRSEEDDTVIPYEGGKVQPVTRPIAPGVHLKAKAQLAGEVTWSATLMDTGATVSLITTLARSNNLNVCHVDGIVMSST